MSMFLETMTKAITDYRQILRKYLKSQDRISKIKQLRLKDPVIFQNETLLYRTGLTIVDDIQNNIRVPNEGYYSYHGITKFCKYLEQYLSNYELDGSVVIHKAQKAANAMIKGIQIFSKIEDLTDEDAEEFKKNNQVIASCGSDDQCKIYYQALKKQAEEAPGFYGEVLESFEQEMKLCKRVIKLTSKK